MIIRIAVLLLAVSLSFRACSEPFEPDLSKWRKRTLHKAKSASLSFHPAKNEAEVVFYCNLARLDGKLFVKTILKPYLDYKDDTAASLYKQSLINELNHLPKLQPLHTLRLLTQMAKDYATSSGKQGIVGHKNFDKRFASLLHSGRTVGENCAYNQEEPLDVVIDLLIDEGISDLGHRRNILSPVLNGIGVGIAKHRDYGNVWVMEFSGQ